MDSWLISSSIYVKVVFLQLIVIYCYTKRYNRTCQTKSKNDLYGYQIVRELAAQTDGIITTQEGAIYPAIRINRENNEALIVALTTAEVQMSYRGFRKWKAGEKLSESEDDSVRLEYRTDGTDAFDSLYIGCRYHLANMSGMCLPLPE